MAQRKPCSPVEAFRIGAPEADVRPAKLTGAFERYRRAVPEQRVAQMLEGRAAFSREGPYSAWIVMWLMIFQRLHAKGTLSAAVREMLTGPWRTFVRRPPGPGKESLSANTSAYSQARDKLPLEVVQQVSDLIFESLQHEQPKTLPGLGRAMFLLDGSTILLSHSKEMAQAFPPAQNQHGESHWPVLRVLVAHDVVSGLAVRPCWGPMSGTGAVSEQGLTKEILGRLPGNSAVLGDQNFGVFSMAWHATANQHPCLFRLTTARVTRLSGAVVPPSAGTDRSIRWIPSREDARNNPELPADAAVPGRVLAFQVRDALGKRQKLYFFTTLEVPAEQILKLYGYRWNIETDLRLLKREVRLHMLHVQSPDMAAKELLLGAAAYNLTRAAMNQAASALNLDPRQFSFSQAQDTLNAFLPLFASAASDEEREQIMAQMLRVFSQSKLPRRSKRRSAPRTVWPRPCPFPKRKVNPKRQSAAISKGVA